MAVKNANAKTWGIAASADGRRHSRYLAGNAPSGGNAALAWSAYLGIGVGKPIALMSDGTHDLKFPAWHRFTGFSQSSATAGSVLQLADTQFDALPDPYQVVYSNVARGQGRSIDTFGAFSGGVYNALGCRTELPTGTDEVFVSYCVHVPNEAYMPFHPDTVGADPGGPGLMPPAGSIWKMLWVLDADDGTSMQDTNLCVPTLVSNRAHIGGNGIITPPLDEVSGEGVDWFKFGKWNRISSWLKCGASAKVDNGTQWFEAINTVDAASSHTYATANAGGSAANGPLFPPAQVGDVPLSWGAIDLSAWSRSRPSKDCWFYHTDVYYSAGANAPARLEIGNASTFGACTRRAVCIPSVRKSGTHAEYIIERGDVDLSGDSWLFYVNENNTPTLVGKFT